MRRRLARSCALSLVAVGLVPADAVAACRYTDLDGAKAGELLRETMVEARNRSDKKEWREFHFRDGTTSFRFEDEERSYSGKWRVDGHAVCYTYGQNQDCFVFREGSEDCSVRYRLAQPEDGKLVADVRAINWLGHGDEGCFITTAVSRMRGHADDCAQLTLLRWFRDRVLYTDPQGRRDVRAYYDVSPHIVRQVLDQGDATEVLGRYCGPVIDEACRAIRDRQYVRAYALYRTMVRELARSYA